MTDIEEQRKRIIEAAMDVFAEFGFFRAPTQLIAMRAGVSKGLIFWYFKGKDDLILEVASNALPGEVINKCLEKNLTGTELLRCVAESYISKYSDTKMRNLMIHSISASTNYKPLQDMMKNTCSELLKKLTLKAFGEASKENIIKIRAFFGALLCFALQKPTNINDKEYVDQLVSFIYSNKTTKKKIAKD